MARSLIGGLLGAGSTAVADIMVFEPDAQRAGQLQTDFQIELADDNQQLVERSTVVVVAVKPQVLKQVLSPLAAAFKRQQPLLVSIVAGIPSDAIEQWLQGEIAIVRAMPNTPALVGAGATGLYANKFVTDVQKHQAEQLLDAVGVSCWVSSNRDIDTVTALSGSGPAYFMLFINSLIEAAVTAGLDAETARTLALSTAHGSAELIAQSETDIQQLIDNVTSPKGTTEAALHSFHNDRLDATVERAFEAARLRSAELAEELA